MKVCPDADVPYVAHGGQVGAPMGQETRAIAFDDLYNRHRHWLRGFLRTKIPDSAVDDVLQDIFLKVWTRLGEYKPEKASLAAWIRVIAHFEILNFWRKTKRRDKYVVLVWDVMTQAARDGVELTTDDLLELVQNCPAVSTVELIAAKEDFKAALQALLDGRHDPRRIIILLLRGLGVTPLEIVDRYFNQPCNRILAEIKEALMAEFEFDPEMQKIICGFLDALASMVDTTV